MRGRGARWVLGVLAATCLWALPPAATAGDTNTRPPHVELTAAGTEGLVGPRAEALAYFSTMEFDRGAEYSPHSHVAFTCLLDGRTVRCPVEYDPIVEGEEGVLLRPNRRGKGVHGAYSGYVPVPAELACGPHTVTVIATDEDGTDPSPPSVGVSMDRTPPSAPTLIAVPPRRSWAHKPRFEFSSDDDVRFVHRTGNTFTVSLRRIKPSPYRYRKQAGESFLATGWLECPTLLSCSSDAQVMYLVPGFGVSIGMPERLIPAVYLFRVGARDAAGNRSPVTSYRFRILRGKPPHP